MSALLSLESESYVTTNGQSASLSWNKAPIWGLRPDFITVRQWGALSEERTGLLFTTAAGPRQRSHSWAFVTILYCLRFETSLFVGS
jgi:hypothetical protein